eukprot:gene14870-14051_t
MPYRLPWHMTMNALRNVTVCILQFMVLKPLLTFIVLWLDVGGQYGDPRFDAWGSGYVYCTILYATSRGI